MIKKISLGILMYSLMALILFGCSTAPHNTNAQATPTASATGSVLPTVQATAPSPTASATPSAGSFQIDQISMSDATTGWAITTSPHHLILHTSDGGQSWQNATPPYPDATSAALPPAFTALNGNVAWVGVSEKQEPNGTIPGVVFRTSDGGQSWRGVLLPTGLLGVSQIQFVNAQDGWVLSDFGGGAAGSEAVDLLRSTDGGQTWSLVARAGSPSGLPVVGLKTGMGWISTTTGWITGCICAAENTVFLSRTQDAGVTWQTQALPLPAVQGVFTTQPPVFFSATEGMLPVTVNSGKDTLLAVYATHDGGATWSHSTLLMGADGARDFLTMQQGWVVVGNGATLGVTSNGGQTWFLITPSANFRNISQLDFVSAQEGWAISTPPSDIPVLLKTMDGGHTWVQVS